MPTYRDNIHLGTKDPVIDGGSIADQSIGLNHLSEDLLKYLTEQFDPECITLIISALKALDYGPISGYVYCPTADDFPVEPLTNLQKRLAYIYDGHFYVYVGENGDFLEERYKDLGVLRGPKGDTGATGLQGPKGDNGVVLDGVTVFSSATSLEDKTTAQKEEMVPDGNMVEELKEDLHDAIWELTEDTAESNMTSLFSFTDGNGVLMSGPKSDSNSNFAYSNIVALPEHAQTIKVRLPYRPTSGSNIGMAFYSSNGGYLSTSCVGGKKSTSYSNATNLYTATYSVEVPSGATHMATSWFSAATISSGTGTLTPFSCVAIVLVEKEIYEKRFIENRETIEGVDLVISDEEDHDIAVFYDGHFRTKNFNSKELVSSRYSGKRLCILGDSISTFGVPDQSNATGTWTYAGNRCRYPQGSLFTNVAFCYWYKLLQRTGMVLGVNESWAGSRISWDGSTESTDIGANKHIASLTRIGHLGENGIPDVILVYAGTNDAGHSVTVGTFNTTDPSGYTEEQIAALPVNTFADAYRTMLIRLQYYYPTSEIICCFPNYTTSYYNVSKLDTYNEVVRTACDYFGVKYIDLRTAGITMFNRDSYLPDGIHPNAAGMQLIYEKIYNNIIFG